eukprot:318780-Prorocentrum_minimum.AAC.1
MAGNSARFEYPLFSPALTKGSSYALAFSSSLRAKFFNFASRRFMRRNPARQEICKTTHIDFSRCCT